MKPCSLSPAPCDYVHLLPSIVRPRAFLYKGVWPQAHNALTTIACYHHDQSHCTVQPRALNKYLSTGSLHCVTTCMLRPQPCACIFARQRPHRPVTRTARNRRLKKGPCHFDESKCCIRPAFAVYFCAEGSMLTILGFARKTNAVVPG